ncbi:unnamed protein product [Didymodactylos carnosus]|uniref:C2 domain-containing protein n=1 Tax=Didymodactylos carnosus TaxID=1234261 RepID=A0A815UDY1_9BILA|nr:unnamed protein product [Didymodactylos carnosus]CAF4377421.1 unnamed protein product [Didymodactylos carnosus]
MSDLFRNFVESQIEKMSTPRNIIVDKINSLKQTVETFKGLTTETANINNKGQVNDYSDKIVSTSTNEPSNSNTALLNVPTNPVLRASVSSSSSASSSTSTEPYTNNNPKSQPLSSSSRLTSSSPNRTPPTSPPLKHNSPTPSSPQLLNNIKVFTENLSRRTSLLRRHLSENNQETTDDTSLSLLSGGITKIYNTVEQNTTDRTHIEDGRSRTLIRQSTDTTCTFPVRQTIRRQLSVETVEIPGLNGVKVVRYLHDNLGRLQPDLYKQIPNTDPSYGYGKIYFNLFYNLSLTSFIVFIDRIENLPGRDLNRLQPCDAYVKLNLLPERRKKYQTKVQKRNLNPSFQETFQFNISYDELCKRTLLLAVYDFGRITKRSLIGTVKIDDLQSFKDLKSNEIACQRSIVPGTEVSIMYYLNISL